MTNPTGRGYYWVWDKSRESPEVAYWDRAGWQFPGYEVIDGVARDAWAGPLVPPERPVSPPAAGTLEGAAHEIDAALRPAEWYQATGVGSDRLFVYCNFEPPSRAKFAERNGWRVEWRVIGPVTIGGG